MNYPTDMKLNGWQRIGVIASTVLALVAISACSSRPRFQPTHNDYIWFDTQTGETEQWLLESYNEKTGYMFRKDGVHYTAHCRISYLYEADNVLPATSESECSAVLQYLHKPLPLEQGPRGPDLQFLRFIETHEGGTKGWHCEFVIAEAN